METITKKERLDEKSYELYEKVEKISNYAQLLKGYLEGKKQGICEDCACFISIIQSRLDFIVKNSELILRTLEEFDITDGSLSILAEGLECPIELIKRALEKEFADDGAIAYVLDEIGYLSEIIVEDCIEALISNATSETTEEAE